jgi:hypothetical protein
MSSFAPARSVQMGKKLHAVLVLGGCAAVRKRSRLPLDAQD